jgi:ankyrin repeat protein
VTPLELVHEAFEKDDATRVRELLDRHAEFKARINEPVGPFDSPAILNARSPAMLDVLVDAGADINAKSRWWAGGFGVLHNTPSDVARRAIERGAVIDAHAAARLGFVDKLRELIAANSSVVHERGGDGQTPLHFASSVESADLLLAHGADIDARDVDHESTPAQWMMNDRQAIARHLIARGCCTDILMAAGVGDLELVRRHLADDPACVGTRVTPEFFPMRNPKAGGTIYQWTLGWHVTAHDIAKERGHNDILALLLANSPPDLKLMFAFSSGDAAAVTSLLTDDPQLVSRLSPADRQQLVNAARNNKTTTVRLMLAAGVPADLRGQHSGTLLHWAAFHGNLDMTGEILRYKPPLDVKDKDFGSTPLGWAIHGSENGWFCKTGDYAGTVEALVGAGASLADTTLAGTDAVKAVLRRHGVKE